jgi:hypothetical protein
LKAQLSCNLEIKDPGAANKKYKVWKL